MQKSITQNGEEGPKTWIELVAREWPEADGGSRWRWKGWWGGERSEVIGVQGTKSEVYVAASNTYNMNILYILRKKSDKSWKYRKILYIQDYIISTLLAFLISKYLIVSCNIYMFQYGLLYHIIIDSVLNLLPFHFPGSNLSITIFLSVLI